MTKGKKHEGWFKCNHSARNPVTMMKKQLHIIIDRPLGSTHPKHKNIIYGVNYGYVPTLIGGDGEEQDAYLLGVDSPVSEFTGELIAIIRREDDNEEKWVVAPTGMTFTADEIMEKVHFQEQYFKSTVQLIK